MVLDKAKYPLLLFLALFAPAAVAAEVNAVDTAWVMVCTALVLFMTLPGLSLFYAGLVRARNVLSVLMQCFSIACLVSLLWMALAYGLAFGDGGALHSVIGAGPFFMSDITFDTPSAVADGLPASVFLMFQMTFAIITLALIMGSLAERMRFSAVLWFSALWLLVVYAPVCHWVWSGGWLAERGFMDFAGGAVVHMNAGIAGLVVALVLGRRRGFPELAMPPHNMALTVIGASILWVGWFGFNAGSALSAGASAGMAMVVTQLAASAAALSWMACEWLRHGKPNVLGLVTGMVAGLVAITPASGFVGPVGAVLIGVAAGVVCYFATWCVKRVWRVDDSLDVFPVHGVGGMVGTVLTPVFALEFWGGVSMETGLGEQLGVQILGSLAVIVWCAVASFLILKVLDALLGLRVTEEDEVEGLDLTQHDERAYGGF